MSDLNTGFSTSPKSFEGLEQETCRCADVVFATARTLVERARRWADNVVYLPNGVDLETFTGDFDEPSDLEPILGPRLIYVGSFSDWVDYDMFEHIARQMPHSSVVLIGPISGTIAVRAKTQRRLNELSCLPNLHYLGPRPQLEMRHYLAHSDVALIPFIASELTHAVSPVKLFEYGAAGLPVVARELEEARLNAGATLFYNTPVECIESIEKALSEKETLGKEMRAFAERNTWKARYASVREALSDLGLAM
jgi:glycosyltransferase involved in cell wall biosynthesis